MRHPVLGPIVMLVASKTIAKGEEVKIQKMAFPFFVFLLSEDKKGIVFASTFMSLIPQVLTNYNYDLKSAPEWYKKEYKRALKTHQRKETEKGLERRRKI